MKNNWKRILTTFAFFSVSHTALMKIVFDEFDRQTVSTGIFLGLLFACFSRPVSRVLKENVSDIDLKPNERLLRKESADHFRGWETVGGALSLTNKRLVFKPHKFNIQSHQREFPVSEIKAFLPDHQLANALKMELTNNETHTFVVESPSDWIHALAGHQP